MLCTWRGLNVLSSLYLLLITISISTYKTPTNSKKKGATALIQYHYFPSQLHCQPPVVSVHSGYKDCKGAALLNQRFGPFFLMIGVV